MKKLLLIVLCLWAIGAMAQTKRINYRFFKRNLPEMQGQWYSAVIRPIDPKKDDYKGYCRYIVKDIVKKSGLNSLTIAIYDNDKAYHMYEGINYGHILSKAQMDFVNKHIVALYDGKADDPQYEESYQLDFYGDANNGHKGVEMYKP